ncbi:MAG: exodeoxyribonuclease III [Ferrovum sp. 37-45-19]|jgi:exodeoxyribonuclease-3|nr:MAG: exodeoxyribonuclease III [Ferrovum sp. 21-44-67]OYV94634.1 MAG: exodeoxyribonuclease III [Ferrovum sp. 37-45-19]OZB34542.1 MAG: exodeoxyribonuclease III [Ferrovum sp. 34-44-207]HQT81492.1 exodeoxyribonuclease III [Ferrovaceae bacterium]HQU06379.1 exodeoxyribonuclease III [Ferrovaceae bacterium]
MRIATWNVNSIKVRMEQVGEWIHNTAPDVLCLQELKCETSQFPLSYFSDLGYHAALAGQKTYNGVAILSRHELSSVEVGIPRFDDPQQRVVAANINTVRVISAYCPNGESVISDKYQYKLKWFKELNEYLKKQLVTHKKLIILGDFNIAPSDMDVYDPKVYQDEVLCTDLERQAFQELLSLGLVDGFRHCHPDLSGFTWWHYRMNAFKRKMGLRIDHILVSQALVPALLACEVDINPRGNERPSDHAPLFVDLSSSNPSS